MFDSDKPLPKILYVLGIVVIFLAVYSQYFIHFTNIFGVLLGEVIGYLVVYGLPILVVSLILGRELLRKAAKNNLTAAKYGVGLFGVMTVVGIFLSALALMIIMNFEPQAQDILNKTNPALDVPSDVAWIMIAVSLIVVGPAEEYLFRGFMYGGLLKLSKGKNWLPLAVLSSVLFAVVHGYYAVTYGITSILFFISLSTFGFAMCVTYYWSNGNILMPALIHGVYDATGFLSVAYSTQVGLAARSVFIAVGVAFAFVFLLRKILIKTKPAEQPPPPPQPATQPPRQA